MSLEKGGVIPEFLADKYKKIKISGISQFDKAAAEYNRNYDVELLFSNPCLLYPDWCPYQPEMKI